MTFSFYRWSRWIMKERWKRMGATESNESTFFGEEGSVAIIYWDYYRSIMVVLCSTWVWFECQGIRSEWIVLKLVKGLRALLLPQFSTEISEKSCSSAALWMNEDRRPHPIIFYRVPPSVRRRRRGLCVIETVEVQIRRAVVYCCHLLCHYRRRPFVSASWHYICVDGE